MERRFVAGLPELLGRPRQLAQVFVNLVTNACQAARSADEPRLLIATGRDERALTVVVEDNGVGIDPAQHEQIFMPFFTTKAIGVGTGLGLSIVKNIVEVHRGTIEVSSAAPGTRFSVTFPLE